MDLKRQALRAVDQLQKHAQRRPRALCVRPAKVACGILLQQLLQRQLREVRKEAHALVRIVLTPGVSRRHD